MRADPTPAPLQAVLQRTADRRAPSTGERRSDAELKTALTGLASQLTAATGSARDQDKVQTLAKAVTDLANAQR